MTIVTSKTRAQRDEMSIGFTPISISAYLKLHAASNPGDDINELSHILQKTLEAKLAGALCQCGEPIWAIGSVQVGRGCFACITGETAPHHDYEVVPES